MKKKQKVLLAGCHFIWTINWRWMATNGKLDKYISKVFWVWLFSLYRSLPARLSMFIIGQCRFNIQHFHVIHSSIQHTLRSFKENRNGMNSIEKFNARNDFKWQLWTSQVENISAARKWRFSVIKKKWFYEGWSLRMKFFMAYDISVLMIPIKDVWKTRCNQYQTIFFCSSYENQNLFTLRENDLVVVWQWSL